MHEHRKHPLSKEESTQEMQRRPKILRGEEKLGSGISFGTSSAPKDYTEPIFLEGLDALCALFAPISASQY